MINIFTLYYSLHRIEYWLITTLISQKIYFYLQILKNYLKIQFYTIIVDTLVMLCHYKKIVIVYSVTNFLYTIDSTKGIKLSCKINTELPFTVLHRCGLHNFILTAVLNYNLEGSTLLGATLIQLNTLHATHFSWLFKVWYFSWKICVPVLILSLLILLFSWV